MEEEILYTESDLIKSFHIKLSRSRYHQYRKGYKRSNGSKVEPVLIEGTDWKMKYGKPLYTNAGLIKLLELTR